MTVVFDQELAETRSSSNDKGIMTYTLGYQLFTSERSDTAHDVQSHPTLPTIGSPFPDNPNAVLTTKSAANRHPWRGWIVTCNYSTETQLDPEPELDAVVVTFSSEGYTVPAWTDADGRAIVNSAGDRFLDPAIMRDKSHLIIKTQSNHRAVPDWILSYMDAINDSSFRVSGLKIPKMHAKVMRVEVGGAQYREDGDGGTIEFFPLSLDVHVHSDGWAAEPLDAGFREWIGYSDDTERVQIENSGDNTQPTQPVPLDGHGHVIDDPNAASNRHVFLEFQLYDDRDFRKLPGFD